MNQHEKAIAIIDRMLSGNGMTFRGVPMQEFTKEQILRVLRWQMERQEKAFNDHYKASAVFG